MTDEPACEYCGRKSTPENPVTKQPMWGVDGEEANAWLCQDDIGCVDYVGIHGNDEQQATWHYA